jgi:hypothetical protein
MTYHPTAADLEALDDDRAMDPTPCKVESIDQHFVLRHPDGKGEWGFQPTGRRHMGVDAAEVNVGHSGRARGLTLSSYRARELWDGLCAKGWKRVD